MANNNTLIPASAHSFIAEADLSGYQYKAVILGTSNGQVNAYTGTGTVIGIQQNLPTSAIGEGIDVAVSGGGAFVKLGDTVTKGAALTLDSVGRAIPVATSTDKIIGYALDAGVVSSVIEVFMDADYNGGVIQRDFTCLYDFSADGGAVSAISLDMVIPDNFIVTSGMIDVITTFKSTAGGTDKATLALHLQTANDIVSAVAIETGTPWDVGLQQLIPVGTAATAIKMTAARTLTLTIGTAAVTAGKMQIYLSGYQSI